MKKPYQPKTFDVVFNGARGINPKTIQLVWNGAEYIYFLRNFIRPVLKGLFRKVYITHTINLVGKAYIK